MTTYRLKATRGYGWVEGVDARGPTFTAIKGEARTWDDIEVVRRALARVNLPGKVPCEIVGERL